MQGAGFPIILSSPSGGGKTTISNQVLKNNSMLERVITATTRSPRLGEKDGVDYHFWTKEKFLQAVENDEMAEWANVHTSYYGVPRKSLDTIMESGKLPMLVIDVQGAKSVQREYVDSVLIFLAPPSFEVLKQRLLNRPGGTDSIEVRLETAKREIQKARDYKYFVINDTIEKAVSDINSIICAEALRTDRVLTDLILPANGEYKFK